VSVVGALALGFAAGVVGGLLGVGGGILFVPALTIFLDKTQLEAEATSLVAIVPVALVGVWRQWHFGNVRVSDGVVIGLLSPLGVLAGAVLANAVSPRTLEISFALLVLAFAYRLARRALRPLPETLTTPPLAERRKLEVD
jgi:uncharacterized membrane protein YfcA